MRYAAWATRMATPDGHGSPTRDSYLVQARKGSASALAMLDGPPFPDALAYLWRWYGELRRGCAPDATGAAVLTWPVLDAWARRTHRDPEPYEADALFTLDAVMRQPDLAEQM